MSTACVTRTFTSQKLVSFPMLCLQHARLRYMQTYVRCEAYRAKMYVLGNCVSTERCHQASVCSTCHVDSHVEKLGSSHVTSGNHRKSMNIFERLSDASYRPKENFSQQLEDKNLKFPIKPDFVCEKASMESFEPGILCSWKHLPLCSNTFQLSKQRMFKRLLSADKYLCRPIPSGYCRPYHTGVPSFPLLNKYILLKTPRRKREHTPEWSGHRCIHQEALPDRFNIRKNRTFKQYLDSLLLEFEHINRVLSNQTAGHNSNLKEVNSRIVELTPIVSLIHEVEKLEEQVRDLDVLVSGLHSDDTEMRQMAALEREECVQQMEQQQLQLIDLMVGQEQADKNDIILEVSAGVGGQEAMLFTGEMFDLYQAYSYWKGWTFDSIALDISEQGGMRKASASVCGVGVYRLLKFESGVHRVQRVPKTEKAGRIHTSTMTVAVLPQPTEIEVVIHPKDLRVETFKAGGKGGQHVNTTDSAVRMTHLPTGMVAECQQERSQIKNKAMALKILRSRIYEKELESQQLKTRADRKVQVGSAGRSEKIRTYNFPQDRITDHRINYSMFNLGHFLATGEDLNSLIAVLLKESQYSVLDGTLEVFARNRDKQSA